jgi:hypothetical protein
MTDEQASENGNGNAADLRRRYVDGPAETFTLQLSDEDRAEWKAYAELSGETLEQTIRRLMRRAITERADFDRSRREFPS